MLAIALLPLVLAIVGALIHAFATRSELKEIGRAMLWAGLFAFAFATASHVVRIGTGP